jgi:hypothetical protein
MAGIAATFAVDPPDRGDAALAALAAALAIRGSDAAAWQSGPTGLVVRAAIPTVHEEHRVALVVDGIADVSSLFARYAERSGAGLLAGGDPYAVILADPAQDVLFLARNGDGPPLYYAATATGVLVASEPAALLTAGVPADIDATVVDRFLTGGACDDSPATFLAGVRRVLAGQVVVVTGSRGGGGALAVRTHQVNPTPDGEGVSARLALQWSVLSGRIGVRLGNGIAGAALLGTALARPDRPRPLPVYSATFPGLPSTTAEYAAAVLGPLAHGAARHRALPFFADAIDLDAYLADLGEPTPDLAGYLVWATARATAGEVEALIDTAGAGVLLAAGGSPLPAARRAAIGHLARLADRVESRFGVALRFPFAEVPNGGEVLRAQLDEIVGRTLPATAARFAATPGEVSAEVQLREVLLRMRGELAEAFLNPRHPAPTEALLRELSALESGRRIDAGAMFRRYAVERWLRVVAAPAASRPGVPVQAAPPAGPPVAVSFEGAAWARFPVHTEALSAGDRVAEKLAWYVGEFATGRAAEHGSGRALRRPWYVLVAAKPVAVAQGRARNLWEIRPSWYAHVLDRVAGRATGVETAWAMQVAIEQGGRARMLAAAACALVGRRRWYDAIAGLGVRSVRGPRPDAVPPAHIAVVPPPREPDQVAADVIAALRTALPAEAYAGLAGCAVVGVDGRSCRVAGWAAGAAASANDRGAPGARGALGAHGAHGARGAPTGLLEALCAGNPSGQAGEHTPIVVAAPAPRAPQARASRRSKGRAGRR